MALNFGKAWLEALEAYFGEVSEIKEIETEGKPKIFVFYFENLPEEGLLTAITCGLSNSNHPDWKYGKPELVVTLETKDKSWGLVAGYFASTFFDEKRFSYGDVFKLDYPITAESDMNAFLLFAPSFLDQEQAKIELPDRTVILVGMYPIHNDEIAIYDKLGLKEFWHSDGFDIYNPHRSAIKSVS